MEAGSAAARPRRIGWRLWAVVPVLLLAIAVGAVVSSGSSLADLIGTNPPPADEFDIRRVEFSPGLRTVRSTASSSCGTPIRSSPGASSATNRPIAAASTTTGIRPASQGGRRTGGAAASINP